MHCKSDERKGEWTIKEKNEKVEERNKVAKVDKRTDANVDGHTGGERKKTMEEYRQTDGLTFIWSCSPAYSMDWKMVQVVRRRTSSLAMYRLYHLWINRAAFMAEDTEAKETRPRHFLHGVWWSMQTYTQTGVPTVVEYAD